MRDLSRKINQCIGCLLLCSIVGFAGAVKSDLPVDGHGLKEIRHLSELPHELASVVGWHHKEDDRISDLEREPSVANPGSFDRWFVLGGVREKYALIAIEERGAYRSYDRIHADAFSLVGAEWVFAGESVLSARPHTVEELLQLLHSRESQTLTARWQKSLRDRDLQRRMAESDPARHRLSRLRDIDIGDEEIRQIEGVVRDLMPGAIVMISGVAKGCTCEDGPGCSAQVWIAVHLPKQTRSLELSDINDHWDLGPVQRWFLESAELKRSNYPTYADYAAARNALNDRYPMCAVPAANRPVPAANRH
jgi:hypothetical protein